LPIATSRPWFSQQWKVIRRLRRLHTNSATMNGDKPSTLHHLFILAMQHKRHLSRPV
jgi:hypothetical protein